MWSSPLISIFLIISHFMLVFCAVQIVPLITGSVALGTAVYLGVKCKISECCDSTWINCENATNALSESFNARFYGQHIAAKALLSVIDGYCSRSKVKSASPWKAVVVSLHGPTGVGKSHVSHLIAQALFKSGMDSNFVHFFDLATDLRSEEELSKLHDWILGNASVCANQLFIFNEIDKADAKFAATFDKLHKFLDYGAQEQGIDLTNVIYLFLGNLGTSPLMEEVTAHYRLSKRRESISARDLEFILERAAFDQNAGLFQSEIVRRKLVDAFIPFLPMERHHVEQCVQAELNMRCQIEEDGVIKIKKPEALATVEAEEKLISEIIDQLQFEPDDEIGDEQYFAVTGCKEIQRLVQKAMYNL